MTEKNKGSILIQPLAASEGFLAYAIGVDGIIAEGLTEEETLANLKAALAATLARAEAEPAAA